MADQRDAGEDEPAAAPTTLSASDRARIARAFAELRRAAESEGDNEGGRARNEDRETLSRDV